jgi:Ca2+-binding RTX toxin-like protein
VEAHPTNALRETQMFRDMLRSASDARINARRARRRAAPSLQTLEGRALLAASIVYDPIAEDIIITGSNAADVAVVEQDDGGPALGDEMVVVTVQDGSTGAEISLSVPRYEVVVGLDGLWSYQDNVDLIRFSGGSGADRFTNETSVRCSAYGGTGDDVLIGGSNHDSLHGEDGNDRLSGGDGIDYLYGDGGHDRLSGEGGNDVIFAGSGDDNLLGGAGNDRLVGHEGDDVLSGGSGDDDLDGLDGDDVLYGSDGDDELSGGDGYDRLYGQAGDDVLDGGTDGVHDLLSGGSGADTFETEYVFEFVNGVLVLSNYDDPVDFELGTDSLA